jgi:uncharacterized protein YqgC (DUF456 family)
LRRFEMESQIGGTVFAILGGIVGFVIGAFLLRAIFRMNHIVTLLEEISRELIDRSPPRAP